MSDPTKVYVVTSGSYSDYGIHCVFTDKALADEYVRRYNLVHNDEADIEEYDANGEQLTEPLARTKCYFPINEDTLSVGAAISAKTIFIDPADGRTHEPYLGSWDGLLGVEAINAEHAFKIACDWWAQEKAKQAEGEHNAVDVFLRSQHNRRVSDEQRAAYKAAHPEMSYASMGTIAFPISGTAGWPILPS